MSGSLNPLMYLPPDGRINSRGYWESPTHRQCSLCKQLFTRTNAMSICNKCNNGRVKAGKPEWKMHQRAKQRAKRLGREFTLKVEDISIPAMCPILGIPLVVHRGNSGAFADSPSLDRTDNDRGYTKDNIRVLSQRANQMKGDASVEELLAFADWIIKEYRGG